MEDIIRRRLGSSTLGFHAGHQDKKQQEEDEARILDKVQPEDLLHFGLIPEFIGRLPVISSLRKLTEEELVTILTEPKNALARQYGKQLALNGVKLHITRDGLRALAEEAVKRGTGARGPVLHHRAHHARGHVRHPVAQGRRVGDHKPPGGAWRKDPGDQKDQKGLQEGRGGLRAP